MKLFCDSNHFARIFQCKVVGVKKIFNQFNLANITINDSRHIIHSFYTYLIHVATYSFTVELLCKCNILLLVYYRSKIIYMNTYTRRHGRTHTPAYARKQADTHPGRLTHSCTFVCFYK